MHWAAMAGSPKKRARREAIARGELVPDPTNKKSKRAPHGAPPTPEQIERMHAWVQAGNYMETAAAVAGVDRTVFRRWLQTGGRDIEDGEDTVYAKFVRDLSKVQAEAEGRRVARVERGGTDYKHETVKVEVNADGTERVIEKTVKNERGDWRAAAWALERMYPSRYAQRVRVEVEREIEGVIDELEKHLPSDAFLIVLQVFSKKFGGEEET